MIKSTVMVFSKDAVNGCWKWGGGEYSLSISVFLINIVIQALMFLVMEPGICI